MEHPIPVYTHFLTAVFQSVCMLRKAALLVFIFISVCNSFLMVTKLKAMSKNLIC